MVTVSDEPLMPDEPVVFVDAEFTTLGERYRPPWETAVIRYADGVVTEYVGQEGIWSRLTGQ